MSAEPLDPSIDSWLRSLEPRQELVLRLAMRRRFAEVRADRKAEARIDELRAQFNDEDRLVLILADARLVSEQIEEVFGEAPPETKTRERLRQKHWPRPRLTALFIASASPTKADPLG